MTNFTTIEKLRNYQGQNSFLLSMKQSLQKWGGLTQRQIEVTEKAFNSPVKNIDLENISDEMKEIYNYKGKNTFVLDISEKFKKYGTLTEKQKTMAMKQIEKEKNSDRTIHVKWPTPGETIKVGRSVGQRLKEQYGLKFNPILLDITKILAISPKAVKFSGKMTIKRGNVCMCCAKTLTDEFSMVTKMGKICAKHMGVEYIKDLSQVEKFRDEYMKRVEEIGEMEFWVAKNKIEKWEGQMSQVLDAVQL
jgi:hypothetical protein